MIPVTVKWRSLLMDFKRRGIKDKALVRKLEEQGVRVDPSTVCRLRNGRMPRPSYELGVGLLNLVGADFGTADEK